MIELKANKIDVDTYLGLRQSVHWKTLSNIQAQKAIDNSIYTVVAYDEDVPVGMGRIVGDGAVICYVQDLIVIPTYQAEHIGSMLINNLIDYVDGLKVDDTQMMLCLMCAKGREKFYKKHGFIGRPTDNLGPGMIQYLK